jgi:hypothetical protein
MLNDIVAMSSSSKLRALQPHAFTATILLLCEGSLLGRRQHASTELNCLSRLARVPLDRPPNLSKQTHNLGWVYDAQQQRKA